MFEGGGDAFGGGEGGDVAAEAGDVGRDFGDGVGWAGDAVGDFGVEHGEVVVIVAGDEGEFGADAGESADFEESGALVVVAVGEAEPDAVAVVGEVWPCGAVGFDPVDDAFHERFVVGDDACWFGVVFDEASAFEVRGEVAAEEFEELGVGFVEVSVDIEAAEIPVTEGAPAAFCGAVVDFGFAGDDEVRDGLEAVFAKALERVEEGAAGIDAPCCAAAAEVGEAGFELCDVVWVGRLVDESAVEVEAEESGRWGVGEGAAEVHGGVGLAEAGDSVVVGVGGEEAEFDEEGVDFREGQFVDADTDIEVEEAVAFAFEGAEAAEVAVPPVAAAEFSAVGEGDDAVGGAMEDEHGWEAAADGGDEVGVAGGGFVREAVEAGA